MRKKITSIIIIIQIIIILTNLIYPCSTYAAEPEGSAGGGTNAGSNSNDLTKGTNDYLLKNGEEILKNTTEEGTATITSASGSKTKFNLGETQSSSGVSAGLICSIFAIVPSIVNHLMLHVIKMFQNGGTSGYFTIEDTVLNKYAIFDIDFFDLDSKKDNSQLKTFRENTAIWYYSIRNIAEVANCIILIYIGIRMAISTVAESRAKYKKMLIAWFTSALIIYFMHYIVIIMFSLQDFFIKMLATFVEGEGFEEYVMNNTVRTIAMSKGWAMVPNTMILYAFMYYELKFFFMYFKRTLSINFLFVVSPLITITYAIDAVKDGKSQIFKKWLREMSYNIFIQAIHATVYVVFIFSAGEIAKQSPIMGIVLITSLSRAEKIIEKTFKLSSRITRSESLISKIKSFKLLGQK